MYFASMLENLALNEAVWGVVGLGLTWALGLLYSWMRKHGVETSAVDSLRDGIAQAGDEFVVWRKRAAADGKLTAEDREAAKRMAADNALLIAKGPVLKMLTSWGKPKMEAMISRLVQGEKK
tara:strand:+ start:146 stop:511 length:366 start_codon:yes stop_codon:yes gene_type:complete